MVCLPLIKNLGYAYGTSQLSPTARDTALTLLTPPKMCVSMHVYFSSHNKFRDFYNRRCARSDITIVSSAHPHLSKSTQLLPFWQLAYKRCRQRHVFSLTIDTSFAGGHFVEKMSGLKAIFKLRDRDRPRSRPRPQKLVSIPTALIEEDFCFLHHGKMLWSNSPCKIGLNKN